MPRGRKKHLSIAIFAFADDDNQIQAACIASECAIHYKIACWQHPTSELLVSRGNEVFKIWNSYHILPCSSLDQLAAILKTSFLINLLILFC